MKDKAMRSKIILALVLSAFSLSACSIKGFMPGFFGGKTGPATEDVAGFVSAMKARRGNPESHYRLGTHYQRRGMHKEAMNEFQKTVLIDPAHVNAYNSMAVSCDMLGEFAAAVSYYEKAIELDPERDYLYNNLGYSYLMQKEPGKAIEAFQKAILLNGKSPVFHNNLALAFAMKEEYGKSAAEFAMGSGDAAAHYNLGRILHEKGRYGAAKAHFESALSLDPSLKKALAAGEKSGTLATVQALVESGALSASAQDKPVREPVSGVLPMPAARAAKEENKLKPDVRNAAGPVKAEPPAAAINRDLMRIEISNGNGVSRMARMLGEYLKDKGYKVVRLTNADHFRHSRTEILYRPALMKEAEGLGGELPAVGGMRSVNKFDRKAVNVKILIGRDLVPHKKKFLRQWES